MITVATARDNMAEIVMILTNDDPRGVKIFIETTGAGMMTTVHHHREQAYEVNLICTVAGMSNMIAASVRGNNLCP